VTGPCWLKKRSLFSALYLITEEVKVERVIVVRPIIGEDKFPGECNHFVFRDLLFPQGLLLVKPIDRGVEGLEVGRVGEVRQRGEPSR